jgi:hypothetical protein
VGTTVKGFLQSVSLFLAERLLNQINCDTLYIRVNFVSEPPSCEYTNLPGRFLPYTDRFVPQTYDIADCRRLCDQEREFQCRSFNYNTARRDCFLSSDDTFAADKTALLSDRDFFYSEHGSCSNGKYQHRLSEILSSKPRVFKDYASSITNDLFKLGF